MISIDGQGKVTGLNRQQWMGLENAPTTTVFNVSIPFQIGSAKSAAGILFYNDKWGLFANRSVYLQYAYRREFQKGLLSFGANLGFLSNTFDGSQLAGLMLDNDYHKKDDPYVPMQEEGGNAFDISIGAAYYDTQKYAGIALSHITAPAIGIGERATMSIRPMLNITGGYNFSFSDALYILKPSMFFKTDFASMQLDINTLIEYKQRFFGGLSYRIQDAIVVLIGAKMSGVTACYSYDITTSKLARVSGGSHEITLSYSFTIERTNKNTYKSVRIL